MGNLDNTNVRDKLKQMSDHHLVQEEMDMRKPWFYVFQIKGADNYKALVAHEACRSVCSNLLYCNVIKIVV